MKRERKRSAVKGLEPGTLRSMDVCLITTANAAMEETCPEKFADFTKDTKERKKTGHVQPSVDEWKKPEAKKCDLPVFFTLN